MQSICKHQTVTGARENNSVYVACSRDISERIIAGGYMLKKENGKGT